MARSFHIIDGYNLMHAAGLVRERFGPRGLERGRERLLRLVAKQLTETERSDTTIVFDVQGRAPDGSRDQIIDGMTVLFNRPGSDADTLIEELIAGHSAAKQVRVVSSDHRLQRAARRRKSSFIDSDDFLDELSSRVLPAEPDGDASSLTEDGRGRDAVELGGDEDWTAHIEDVISDLKNGRLR